MAALEHRHEHPLLSNQAAITIPDAHLVMLGGPIDTNIERELTCHNHTLQRKQFARPPQPTSALYWRSKARTPHRTFGYGPPSEAQLRFRRWVNSSQVLHVALPRAAELSTCLAHSKGTGVTVEMDRQCPKSARAAESARTDAANNDARAVAATPVAVRCCSGSAIQIRIW